MSTNDKIEAIAMKAAIEECFTEKYKRETNLEKRKMEGLGICISQYCEWDGLSIMQIFASALDDSNFHEEAAKVEEWIKSLETD